MVMIVSAAMGPCAREYSRCGCDPLRMPFLAARRTGRGAASRRLTANAFRRTRQADVSGCTFTIQPGGNAALAVDTITWLPGP